MKKHRHQGLERADPLEDGPAGEDEGRARVHACTSWTSPAFRSRVRPVASRKTSSSVGSRSRPAAGPQLGLQLGRRPLADDAAVVDDGQSAAELVGLLEVLGGEEDGGAPAVDAADLVPHRQPAGRVEAGGGLVEEQHLGPVDEGRGQVEPPLHPARVALERPVGGVDQLDQLQQLLGPGGGGLLVEAEEPTLEDEQLAPALALVEPGLLQGDADLGPHPRRVGGDVDAGDGRLAGGDRQQGRQHPDGGGLAGAVRARGSRRSRPAPPGGRRPGRRRCRRPWSCSAWPAPRLRWRGS